MPIQTAADGQWMEGLLREVLPRDTQDGASAKRQGGLLLRHPFPKLMVCFPCVEGFTFGSLKTTLCSQHYSHIHLKVVRPFAIEKTKATAENILRPCRMSPNSWGSSRPRKLSWPHLHDRKPQPRKHRT